MRTPPWKTKYSKSQEIITSPLWEHVVKRITVIEDRLLSDILERHYCYKNMSSGWVNLAYDSKADQ